jgi:hypothetical protein
MWPIYDGTTNDDQFMQNLWSHKEYKKSQGDLHETENLFNA